MKRAYKYRAYPSKEQIKKHIIAMHEAWLDISTGWTHYWGIVINMMAYASIIELLILEIIPSLKNMFSGTALFAITMGIFIALNFISGHLHRKHNYMIR